MTKEEEEIINITEEEQEESEEENESQESDNRIPIDLSQNEVYRGVCTLFEDEHGNNILEYISLLHTELIGINKSLENLKSIKKDISRMADCAELFVKSAGSAVLSITPEKKKHSKSTKD